MTAGDGNEAARCLRCGLVIVSGPEGTHLACFECGAMIPPNESICRKCGWSYDAREP